VNEPADPPVLPPSPPSPPVWPAWVAALGIGAAGWLLTLLLGGRREAWDSPLYYQVAYPLFGLTAAVLGYLRPGRPWRWALALALGQALVALGRDPTANLLPLGLVAFGVFSAPLILPAQLGSRLRRWREGG
jgi:hypothetical protein